MRCGIGARIRGLDGLSHNGGKLHRFQHEHELAGIDLGHEEQIADEAEQPVGVAVDDPEHPILLLVEPCVFPNDLEVAADRGERRAQLMRDRSDEVVFHPIELAQALVLLGELAQEGVAFGLGCLAFGDVARDRRHSSHDALGVTHGRHR